MPILESTVQTSLQTGSDEARCKNTPPNCPLPSFHFPVVRFFPGMLREMIGRSEKGGMLAVDVTGAGHRWVLSALGRFVGAYHPLYCVDAGNAFDPFCFVETARKRGEDPRETLEHIYVSRVFTCHQLFALMKEEVPQLCRESRTPILAVLGITDLFYDENLPFWEREYLYRRTLERMKRARDAGLPLVVSFRERPEGSGARLWRWLLSRDADRVTRIRSLEGPQACPAIPKSLDGVALERDTRNRGSSCCRKVSSGSPPYQGLPAVAGGVGGGRISRKIGDSQPPPTPPCQGGVKSVTGTR